MRIVALEEHVVPREISEASAPELERLSPFFVQARDARLASQAGRKSKIQDLSAVRLADMDAGHISMQVLSNLFAQQLPRSSATELCRSANEDIATAMQVHPTRFSGFAALPTATPAEAVAELDRCVTELGFVGTLICGRTEGVFLDDARFEPLLERAARLNVPIYLHPAPPPREVSDSCYSGFAPGVSARFETGAWGWHNEAGIHFLRLVLAGVFDRYPGLQVVLGHWGEMVPFFIDRLDHMLPPKVTGLERTMSDYLRQNAYVTPSGMWSQAQLDYCVATVGADRIMFSVDYPFFSTEGAVSFLDSARLTPDQRADIAHRTADRLLGLTRGSVQ